MCELPVINQCIDVWGGEVERFTKFFVYMQMADYRSIYNNENCPRRTRNNPSKEIILKLVIMVYTFCSSLVCNLFIAICSFHMLCHYSDNGCYGDTNRSNIQCSVN